MAMAMSHRREAASGSETVLGPFVHDDVRES